MPNINDFQDYLNLNTNTHANTPVSTPSPDIISIPYTYNTTPEDPTKAITVEIKVKTSLTVQQKIDFINAVVRKSVTTSKPEYYNSDVAFDILFIDTLTDLEFPTISTKIKDPDTDIEEDILVADIQRSVDLIESLDLINKIINADARLFALVTQLKEYCKRQVDFEKEKILSIYRSNQSTEEAVEAVASVFYKVNNMLEKVNDKFGVLLDGLTQEKALSLFESVAGNIVKGMMTEGANGADGSIDEPKIALNA
jgi:cell fate (sporulation/competence/biofilm development) regulator YmcA (YheA/YmcA/DUF963 family)